MDDLEISRDAELPSSDPAAAEAGGPEAAGPAPEEGEVLAEAPEILEAPETADVEEAPETDPDAADAPQDGELPPAEGEARQDEDAEEEPSPDAPELSEEDLVRQTSALVFASPEPLSDGRLSKLLGGVGTARVRRALELISQRLDQADLGLQLRRIAGGTTYLTTPDLGPVVSLLVKARSSERVSPAALETLSVVAYRQPVTKAEIEAIRGVQAGPILRTLVDRGLIRVTGRADVPGHPLQYGTTREFLDRFGLGSLDELPRDAELARG